MAFGQIDPARLQGEALKGWYLRSPEEVEAQRRQTADRAHEDFFRQPQRPRSEPVVQSAFTDRAGNDPVRWSRLTPDRWRAEREPQARSLSLATGIRESGARQPPLWNCAGCHGPGAAPPLPPPFGPFPWPIGPFPFRGTPPRSSGDRDEHPKQCDQQLARDTEICGRERKPDDRAICRASASERLAHCLSHDGEVGQPPLDTTRRLRGR
jgi:hypothetical protein